MDDASAESKESAPPENSNDALPAEDVAVKAGADPPPILENMPKSSMDEADPLAAELANLKGYDESAKSTANIRENKHTRKNLLESTACYETSALRKGESVADMGRDCMALHYEYGYDFSRKLNLFFIEDVRILFASSSAVVLENIVTGLREFILALDEEGIGAVTVHPSRYTFSYLVF